jgi:predicted acetyltransferase
MTTLARGYEAVDVPADKAAEFLGIAGWAFVFTIKEGDIPAAAEAIPWGRVRGISVADAAQGDVGSLVAVHGSVPYPLAVPGAAEVPASGLCWVGVHQGHRRRGLLTAMIADHFERSLARGEIVSTLFASEPPIYQRFGYGLACPALSLSLGRGPSLRDVTGTESLRVEVTDADRERHAESDVAVLKRESRPGSPVDLSPAMLADVFLDIESWRDGAERKRIVIVTDEHGPAAFATFARKSKWGEGGPDGETSVHQWAAATAAATHKLFSVVGDLDLTGETSVGNVALDHPLLHLLVNPRSPKPRRTDNLWVRILDVPRALEARGYEGDVDVTLEVTDPALAANDGVWRLTSAGGRATVTRAEGPGQIELSIQELSAAYLGGVTLAELASAGLVTGDAAAIAAASAALRGSRAPVSAINF